MLITEDFMLVVRKLSDDDGFDSPMCIGRSFVLMNAVLKAALHAKEAKGGVVKLNEIKHHLELKNCLELAKDESVVQNGYDVAITKFMLDVPGVDCHVIRTGDFPEKAKENYGHYKDYLLKLLNKI